MRSFVAVATHRSFTRAAESEHLAQQVLSQHVRTLERVMGVTLLDRNSRRVDLTPAGAVFLDDARRILSAADQAVDRAVLAAQGEVGRLRIVHTLTTAYDTVPVLLDACRIELPRVDVSLREVWAEDLPALLLDGRADVGLFPGAPLPDGLHLTPVRREPLVALLSTSHPLATRRDVRLSRLKDETFCVWPRPMAPGFYDAVIGACRAAGFEPHVDVNAAGNTIWRAIAEGRGVGLTVQSIERQRPEGIAVVHLSRPQPTVTISAAAPAGDPPLIHRFLSVASTTAERKGWLPS
jgi:DNA-binding transcriptional LysR family regulator